MRGRTRGFSGDYIRYTAGSKPVKSLWEAENCLIL